MEDNGKSLLFKYTIYNNMKVYSQYQWYNCMFIRNKINQLIASVIIFFVGKNVYQIVIDNKYFRFKC